MTQTEIKKVAEEIGKRLADVQVFADEAERALIALEAVNPVEGAGITRADIILERVFEDIDYAHTCMSVAYTKTLQLKARIEEMSENRIN